jgi:hypothetical protein
MNSATMSEGTQLVSLKLPSFGRNSSDRVLRGVGEWIFKLKLESLILAQSERWRRA